MATIVNVQEAKTQLSDLLARVEAGEEVTIARAGKPVARLQAIEAPPPRPFGSMDLKVTDEFFEPLSEQELRAWE